MKQKFTFMTRINQRFTAIDVKKGKAPTIPPGAGSFYARFTNADGKREMKPLGKDAQSAFVSFLNLELAKEFTSRNLAMPYELTTAHSTPIPKDIALANRIAAYKDEIKSNKAHKTYQAYANSLSLFQKSCTRATVEDVTREDLLAFKTSLRDQNFSERSVYNNFLNVMVFLKWCGVQSGVKRADWPRKVLRDPEEYTDAEIAAMRTAATDEERLLIDCLLCTGLRSGELAHLTYGDIDFAHSTWRVQSKEDWNTKTEQSQRSVPVPMKLTAQIKARMEKSARGKSNLIFFNGGGRPNMHMLRIIKAVGERAGVTGRVDDHKFRSTAITRWLRAGNTVPEVMEYVGHKNPAMIMRYAAKVKLQQREFHDRATRAFTGIIGD